jgi:hypothetical protein
MTARSPAPAALSWSGVTARRMARHALAEPAAAERAGPWAVELTMEAFGGRWPRWRQLTSTAAHRGVLCFGPDRDRKVTYTNPGHWLPGFRPADSGAALRMLITRYLYAYRGPTRREPVAAARLL